MPETNAGNCTAAGRVGKTAGNMVTVAAGFRAGVEIAAGRQVRADGNDAEVVRGGNRATECPAAELLDTIGAETRESTQD